MKLRRAKESDLARVSALLTEAGLPELDSRPNLSNLLVAELGGAVIGAVELQVYARAGLLRSLVVAPDERTRGVGHSLFHALLSRASELGLRDLYLLTETFPEFFDKLGFSALPRDEVPPEMRASPAFREPCPDSAAFMRLTLEG